MKKYIVVILSILLMVVFLNLTKTNPAGKGVNRLPTINQILDNIKNGQQVKLAIIGDSVGQGYYATGATTYIPSDTNNTNFRSYVNQIRDYLKTKNTNSDIVNKAYSGWTTTEHINQSTVSNIITLNVNMVFIALGINDSNPARAEYGDYVDANTYKTKLQAIIDQLQTAGIVVVLVKENAIGDKFSALTSGYYYNYATQYIQAVQDVANTNSLSVVDLWTPFNNEFESLGFSGSGIMYDTQHPNQAGHNLIYQQFYNFLNPILTSITISPSTVTINSSQTQPFTATGYDQNNNPMSYNPTWSCAGGNITSDGLFTPSGRGGSASVTCSSGAISDTVNFTVTDNSIPPVFNPQWTFISGDLYFQGQISNIVTGDIITFQYSFDQLTWNDISTTLMGNKYRANFDESGKSRIWYGRLKLSNNSVEYYSDVVSIDLDSLAPKNPPIGYFTSINKPSTFGSFKFGESIFAQEAIIEIINSINQTESNLIDFQDYLDDISSNNLSQSSILGVQLFLENVLSNDLTQSQIVDLRQHLENLLSQNNTSTSTTDYAGYYEGIVSNNLSQSFVAIIREYLEDILSSELSESKVTIFQNYIEKIISNNITESSITDLQEFYGRFEDLIDIVYSDSKIVDIQDYKDNIISDNNVQLQISELQDYIDNILSNNIDESIIDDIQQFVSNLEEILDITLSQSQVEEVQNYLEDITSKNLTRSIVIEQYITKLLKILVTLGYVVKFLKLRYSYTLKPLRYSWKVVGTNVGSFKNGIYNVFVGETQEVPIDIETNDINNTNFSVTGTYQYVHNDGTELDSGIAQSNSTIVFANIHFTTPGSNQKLIYTYTCTQLDVDGNPKPDANVETGIAVIPINCEKP